MVEQPSEAAQRLPERLIASPRWLAERLLQIKRVVPRARPVAAARWPPGRRPSGGPATGRKHGPTADSTMAKRGGRAASAAWLDVVHF